ncbi:MAG TPA: hypothetical protein VGR20_20140 [Acidimicrobiia bacterium]|nr:hypothetical protein [Acidimicrobiia bacterium]
MFRPQAEPIPASAWFGPMISPAELTELLGFLGANNGAAVLVWPRDKHHLERLESLGIPRLLLLRAGQLPPPSPRVLEDFILLPASDAEIHRRLVRLCRSAATRRLDAGAPIVDADGRLLLGHHHLALPGCITKLARALAEHFETPLPEAALLATLPPELRSAAHLAGHVAKLSYLIEALGLEAIPAGHDRYLMRRCHVFLEWARPGKPPLRTVA